MGQLQIGIWFGTLHIALTPHVPGQGSTHLLRMQALSLAQSEFNTHSGRQPTYGSPKNSGKQVHVPFEHSALKPHGDGLQGSSFGFWAIKSYYVILNRTINYTYIYIYTHMLCCCYCIIFINLRCGGGR